MRGEDTAEIKGILRPDERSNLANGHIGVVEHCGGVGQTNVIAIFHGTLTRPGSEYFVEIGGTNATQCGIGFDLFVLVPLSAQCLYADANRIIEILRFSGGIGYLIQQGEKYRFHFCKVTVPLINNAAQLLA